MAGMVFAGGDASKENKEPHAASEQDGSGLVRMFKEGADAIGTHKCAPGFPRSSFGASCAPPCSAEGRAAPSWCTVMGSRSHLSALRTRRTKDLFKQLESRSLTAAEEEIIQQRVRGACLHVAACRAAQAYVSQHGALRIQALDGEQKMM